MGDLVRQLIFVGFYVSMPCSQKVCKHVQIQQHQHGTYLAPIPLMNFNMGALKWSPFVLLFFSNVGFRESITQEDTMMNDDA